MPPREPAGQPPTAFRANNVNWPLVSLSIELSPNFAGIYLPTVCQRKEASWVKRIFMKVEKGVNGSGDEAVVQEPDRPRWVCALAALENIGSLYGSKNLKMRRRGR